MFSNPNLSHCLLWSAFCCYTRAPISTKITPREYPTDMTVPRARLADRKNIASMIRKPVV